MLFLTNPGKAGRARRRSAKKAARTKALNAAILAGIVPVEVGIARVKTSDKRAKKRRRARVSLDKSRRRRKVATRRSTTLKGTSMAKRRRRTRRRVAAAAPRRRRRRAVRRNPGRFARLAANPRRRRRRISAVTRRRHSRRYRRNPGMASGLIGSIVQGLKDGGAVVAGQVAVRKAKGAVTGMLPSSAQAQVASGAGAIALSIASAVAVAIAAKKIIPGQARFVAAGAFSEAINAALATTPIAPYLSAFPQVRRLGPAQLRPGARSGVAAWPGTGNRALLPRVGVAAWPRTAGIPMMAGM